MDFHEYSKGIVEDYLGTVAYVDDLIFSTKKAIQPAKLPQVSIRDLGRIRESLGERKIIDEKVESIQLIPNIDPLAFTNSFAKKGIHCSLLELSKDKMNEEFIKKTLYKSDVIILDWQMHGDNGDSTCSFIKHIIENDKSTLLSLRLIIIYTDQESYKEIITYKIVPLLNEIEKDINYKTDTSLLSGHTKIVVTRKSALMKMEEDKISGEQLPDVIIEEMTTLTAGLVSNTTLRAISILRRNTHKLLATHNKNLDPAYLAHRAMSPNPEDAEELLKSTFIDSIDTLLTFYGITKESDITHITDWLDKCPYGETQLKINNQKVNINNTDRKKWLLDGYNKFINDHLKNNGLKVLDTKEMERFDRYILFDIAADCFCIDDKNSGDFAILTHHKSNFLIPSYKPYLTLGVMIEDINNRQYYICIQQKCDSIRIPFGENRSFLFLPLSESGIFPIIFKNKKGDYIKLKLNDKNLYNLKTITFKETNNGIVVVDEQLEFIDIKGIKYKWILDLKDSHAQRIVNKFAAQLSRVGLDESEWLRRS